MATDNPIVFNIEGLSALALRLRDHAEEMAVEIIFEGAVRDIRLAVQVCDRLAGLRFTIAEIAADVLTRPALTIHRDLFAALDEAERAD
jgi:hypothetical protein